MSGIRFLTNFLKDYRVGAVAKSSPFAVAKICDAFKLDSDVTIVEYGPGDGVITLPLLGRMSEDSKLIAFETNKDFVERLNAVSDPRLSVIHDSVEALEPQLEAQGALSVDYVVSGIPFSFFPPKKRHEMVERTWTTLKPGGKFIVYQYSPIMLKYLKEVFGSENVKVGFIPLNLPSYFLMVAERT